VTVAAVESTGSVPGDIEIEGINTVRGLTVDAVQKAKSGHAGTPMALAPLAHVLFTRVMNYDVAEPHWPNRDRFVLSNGHASMLLYSYLYLTGFGLELPDIEAFRQWGSKTPGHPEYGHVPGVEVTTGPLGQGIANAVGLALAEANLRERFGPTVINHHVFAIMGDGCLEEGVSHEACSLAGHLGLGRLVAIYDDNHITIDGPTELALTDDPVLRFKGYGWHVIEAGEIANDLDALEAAVREGMAEAERPSVIVLRSHIGFPSPKYTDTAKAHGEAIGLDDDEVRAIKEILGLDPDVHFAVPADVLDYYRAAGVRGRSVREAWEKAYAAWGDGEPTLAADFAACLDGRGLEGWASKLPTWSPGESVATRTACSDTLDAITDVVPGLVGGGADLTGNTGTKMLADAGVIGTHDFGGRQIHYGVREHGMGAVMNGMASGNLLPFGGTFFVFSDYMRGAVRVAALSGYKVAFVWSHDSIGVGEDGPTHQPIEQLAAMRAMPGIRVIRPADANETAEAWRVHLDNEGPSAIILSRQKVPVLENTPERAEQGVARGAYVLVDEASSDGPDIVLIGTGSEVQHCVGAHQELTQRGVSVRVVSMPCWELFAALDDEEQAEVLPPGVLTLAVEAATTFGWERYADDTIGIDHFGASAPGDVTMREFGFTVENVVAHAAALLALEED
jgi:transketolase